MAIGPVQLLVLGFDHPDFHGEIIAELKRLKEDGTIRAIDALAVHKDADARTRGVPGVSSASGPGHGSTAIRRSSIRSPSAFGGRRSPGH